MAYAITYFSCGSAATGPKNCFLKQLFSCLKLFLKGFTLVTTLGKGMQSPL